MELKIENLQKTYPNGVHALKGINLTIQNGLFGLLGSNGAGKSSLMRTIATLQEPGAGSVLLNGVDVLNDKQHMRRQLGYLPQEFGTYTNVTAAEMLNHIAILKGITDKKVRKALCSRLLKQTNLLDASNKKLGSYSGGMKQRFGVAQALLGSPNVLIVDEPTAGLDPAERKRFLNMLSEIGEQVIVILSTHIVDDVQEICSSMAIIDKGEVKYQGKPAEAIDLLKDRVWKKTITRAEEKQYAETCTILSSRLTDGMAEIHVLSENNPGSFESTTPDLEDVYFAALKNSLQLVKS